MRLTSIRLAGFKSFVDPATLALSSNLTAVVGPNGCGKSNVIDAVRWVTGESSARQLRGEALEDVIFNGSRARKPVGRASVELRFDNSEGKLGGQYAAFGEISIRRELARDGASRYFINGARSRRRDVVDLFLGTGLGGRSNYAVIEQGAVNRLIEARPEDMRQVLEETAGISKYKERRRETENRIRHTRENLERLDDLIGEVEQRLATLARQAANAEKYKTLKADERRLRAELLALRWAAQNAQVQTAEARLRDDEQALRDATSAQTAARAESDRQSAAQQGAINDVQQQQAAFYDAQAEATRIEQQLAHAREMREMRAREKQQLDERIAALDERIAGDREAATDTREVIEAAQRERAELAEAAAREGDALAAAEQAAADAEAAWERENNPDENPVQALEGERTRLGYGEQRAAQLDARREQRRRERGELSDADGDALAAADERLGEDARTLAADEHRATQAAETEQSLGEDIGAAENTLAALRARLAQAQADLAAQCQIREATLGADDPGVSQWLDALGVTEPQPAARTIRVPAAWRTAAEAALGDALRGFVVAALPAAVDDWPDRRVTLLEKGTGPADDDPPPAPAGSRRLVDLMEGPDSMRALARGVFLVDDLAAALAARAALAPGQCVVTRDGCRVGAATLTTPAAEAGDAGVLEREQRIDELAAAVDHIQRELVDAEAGLERASARRSEARQARRTLEARVVEAQRVLETGRAEQRGRRMRAEQTARRRDEIDAELAEIDAERQAAAEDNARHAERIEALSASAERFTRARRQARARLESAREARETARRRAADGERTLTDMDRRLDGLHSRLDNSDSRLQDAERERAELAERQASHAAAAGDADTPRPDEAERRAAGHARDEAQRALRAAQGALKASEAALQSAARALMAAEQQVEQAREALQQAKIEVETAGVRRAGVAEQIAALDASPEALLADLPADADEAGWAEAIETVERRIQRLGAINLAAIEEHDAEAEREGYLKEQRADLCEALDTLESAIAKIDRETRARFKTTYEQVNARFGEMFPTLFGGGEAALELTEDDWLATGIRVMARPPGKRNASIQMLSGGEKALTAVALLFALFELNPAPFCMLDEIDAPLDDANVSRFCDLLRRMSANVQFIIITHNKLTMALAEQLHGVTMAEPGVSRLVSVDIEQALDMAG